MNGSKKGKAMKVHCLAKEECMSHTVCGKPFSYNYLVITEDGFKKVKKSHRCKRCQRAYERSKYGRETVTTFDEREIMGYPSPRAFDTALGARTYKYNEGNWPHHRVVKLVEEK